MRSSGAGGTGGAAWRGGGAAQPAASEAGRRGSMQWPRRCDAGSARAMGWRAATRRLSRPGAPALTRKSVPRAPRIAAGVFTRMASGDCFAILPETTASVPFFRDVSKAP